MSQNVMLCITDAYGAMNVLVHFSFFFATVVSLSSLELRLLVMPIRWLATAS